MRSPLRNLAALVAALALSAAPTMAAAATSPIQPVNQLVVLSVFATQASAQAVCSQAATSTATAGAAAAAQGAPGCVLPAVDAPPPVGQPVPPPPPVGNFGINWLLAALGAAALIGGLSTLFDDDDDVDVTPISPV